MTPQEALARALRSIGDDVRRLSSERLAVAILDALPEGCVLVTNIGVLHEEWTKVGAEQERERHTPYTKESYHGSVEECSACFDGWPCDTRVVLDALDKTRAAGLGHIEQFHAEAAHAKALAEALRAFLSRPTSPSLMADMEHALAAHDERVKQTSHPAPDAEMSSEGRKVPPKNGANYTLKEEPCETS